MALLTSSCAQSAMQRDRDLFLQLMRHFSFQNRPIHREKDWYYLRCRCKLRSVKLEEAQLAKVHNKNARNFPAGFQDRSWRGRAGTDWIAGT
jgi:hypothetical protein